MFTTAMYPINLESYSAVHNNFMAGKCPLPYTCGYLRRNCVGS